MLLVFVAGGFSGCTPKSPASAFPGPGWGSQMMVKDGKVDPAIISDYQAYIATLSADERKWVEAMDDNIMYSENGDGRLAIIIEIGVKGTYWKHILIYDTARKRIEATKSISGHYAC